MKGSRTRNRAYNRFDCHPIEVEYWNPQRNFCFESYPCIVGGYIRPCPQCASGGVSHHGVVVPLEPVLQPDHAAATKSLTLQKSDWCCCLSMNEKAMPGLNMGQHLSDGLLHGRSRGLLDFEISENQWSEITPSRQRHALVFFVVCSFSRHLASFSRRRHVSLTLSEKGIRYPRNMHQNFICAFQVNTLDKTQSKSILRWFIQNIFRAQVHLG